MGSKPSLKIQEWIKSLDDAEWQNGFNDLLLDQTEEEVDLFELMCQVLDHGIFVHGMARKGFYFKELKFEVDDQTRLLIDSWSAMSILDYMHQRMHNNLPDETHLPNALKIHLTIHSGEKLNKCNQCNYASSRRDHLRTHLKRHSTGEKSNKCNQCNYASSMEGDLRKHLKTHRREKSQKCEQWNRKFKNTFREVLKKKTDIKRSG